MSVKSAIYQTSGKKIGGGFNQYILFSTSPFRDQVNHLAAQKPGVRSLQTAPKAWGFVIVQTNKGRRKPAILCLLFPAKLCLRTFTSEQSHSAFTDACTHARVRPHAHHCQQMANWMAALRDNPQLRQIYFAIASNWWFFTDNFKPYSFFLFLHLPIKKCTAFPDAH